MKYLDLNRYLGMTMIAVMLTLTGCENGNLFGRMHKTGSSNDVATLTSEADDAYRNRDYSRALELYERILAQDPNNAVALYGAAAAAIGTSGLNLGTLVSNVLKQQNASYVSGIADLIQKAREINRPSAQAASNSILQGIDLQALNQVIDVAICRLQKIAAGSSDGKIAQGDLDLLVNYGLLVLMRAVMKPLLYDLIDVTNVGGEYDVVVDPALNAGVCNGSTVLPAFSSAQQQQDFLIQVARDLAGGFAIYNRAVQNSSLGSNSVIARLRDDLAEINEEFLEAGGSAILPAACLTLFDGAGIDVNNFAGYTGPFGPPSGC